MIIKPTQSNDLLGFVEIINVTYDVRIHLISRSSERNYKIYIRIFSLVSRLGRRELHRVGAKMATDHCVTKHLIL